MYCFGKILCQNFILHAIFQSAQDFYEKREGSGLMDPDPGGLKNMRIWILNESTLPQSFIHTNFKPNYVSDITLFGIPDAVH
jgi:hypothetical protein